MNKIQSAVITLLVSVSSLALAQEDPSTDAARQQRMDSALQDYRNAEPGPAARAETSMKNGFHRAGTAIKHGAEHVGHAIGTGMRKTGEAMGRGGKKLQDQSAPAPAAVQ